MLTPRSVYQKAGHFLWLLLALPLLAGSACEKKKPNDPGALAAADRADTAAKPADTAPLTGIDASKLDAEKQKLFYTLVGSLTSPCGKSHSLRTSFSTDTSCKRAPFAVKYVLALVEDEQDEASVRKLYGAKYDAPKEAPIKVDTSKAQRSGNNDAPVRIVEFFDYACGHCAQFRPILEKVIEDNGDKLVVYYMMFPLGTWPHSKSAAQASLAAAAQGKFKPMHALLFERGPQHDRDSVMGYARELGLDMTKFEADYTAAAAQVDADHKQGEAAGIHSTPAIFFNERKYEGPSQPKYFKMWIDEEVAVNR